MNADTTKTDNRVYFELDWNDWGNNLPVTSDADELAEGIKAEIADLIKLGYYPKGLRFEKYLTGGLIDSSHPAFIKISAVDSATLFDFYTAYCGGDKEQAADELREAKIAGFDVSVLS